jgi:hypothetical protein
VTSGQDPGVCIVDQVVRGDGIVGRLTGDAGAVAVKVRAAGPLRVTVVIGLDENSTRWWCSRVRPPRHAAERPRLVQIRAHGMVRGAALLARRQGWRRAASATATVEFDLDAGEMDDDGVLMVELTEPPSPPWTEGRLSPSGAIGLLIDRITVRPRPPSAVHPTLPVDTGCDLAVLPTGAPARFRLDLSVVPPAPPVARSPSNRWTRQKPARAGFKALRAARRVAICAGAEVVPVRRAPTAEVQAVDLRDGTPISVEVVNRRPGSLDLRLPGPAAGPVLIGLTRPHRRLSCRVVPSAVG